jgi:hypothetical protein
MVRGFDAAADRILVPTRGADRPPVQDVDGAFPPIVERNARSTGTDVVGYLTESPEFSTFVRDGDDVYHAYSTTWRELEYLMTYCPAGAHPMRLIAPIRRGGWCVVKPPPVVSPVRRRWEFRT